MSSPEQAALIVFAHGSRVAAANEAVERVAQEAAEQAEFRIYRAAFLEIAEPSLEAAVGELVASGVRRVLVAPYFLTMGMHLTEDLPKILAGIRAKHPGVVVEASAPLDGHPALATILAERAREPLDPT